MNMIVVSNVHACIHTYIHTYRETHTYGKLFVQEERDRRDPIGVEDDVMEGAGGIR